MNIESAKKINRPYFTMTRCKADWSTKAEACKGDIECLKCTKQLRGCLDSTFP